MHKFVVKNFIVIEYQFVQPKSIFRWNKLWWYKPSYASRSEVCYGSSKNCLSNNFDENCLIATLDKNVKNDYKSYSVDKCVLIEHIISSNEKKK